MENNVVCIRYKGEMVKVSRNYFSKLVRAGGQELGPCRRRLEVVLNQGGIGTCSHHFLPLVAPLPL